MITMAKPKPTERRLADDYIPGQLPLFDEDEIRIDRTTGAVTARHVAPARGTASSDELCRQVVKENYS